ncbi:MAG: sulfurtransferase TusA family protein [Candidatus Firestonebacteria bacterium]
MENITPDSTLDCVGLYCPVPIIKTTQKLKELKAGEILEIDADDEGILKDMPAWCKTTGNEYLGEEKGSDGIIKVFVRKSKQ